MNRVEIEEKVKAFLIEELEIEEDTLTPYLEYFARFFGTEEMRKARASVNTEDDYFVDWLDQMPSYTDYDSEGRQSLLLDNTAFDFTISELMESIDLDLVCSEIVKDGVVYRASYNEKKRGGFSTLEEFGKEEAFFNAPPANSNIPAPLFLSQFICSLRQGKSARVSSIIRFQAA